MRALLDFFTALRTLLWLRMDLYLRGLRMRSSVSRLFGHLEPVFVLLWLVLIHALVSSVASTLPALITAAATLLLLLVGHLFIVFEIIARIGRGEGMAAALYQYPLSPMLIHAAEVMKSTLSLPVLGLVAALIAVLGVLGVHPLWVFLWMLLWVLYLACLYQLLQLLLARLLRQRRLREFAALIAPFMVLVVVLVAVVMVVGCRCCRQCPWVSSVGSR